MLRIWFGNRQATAVQVRVRGAEGNVDRLTFEALPSAKCLCRVQMQCKHLVSGLEKLERDTHREMNSKFRYVRRQERRRPGGHPDWRWCLLSRLQLGYCSCLGAWPPMGLNYRQPRPTSARLRASRRRGQCWD
jgi:hypothetical protein